MRTLAVIGASYLQQPLVEKAKEMGLRTICFAWEDGAVCKEICDVFYPVSIIEKETILNICIEERIDAICSIASDVAAPTVAYVAQKMGLIGNDYDAAMLAYNKHLMRRAFEKNNIPCPKFKYVTKNDVCFLQQHLQTFALPVIVKPTDRSGSLGVTRVDCWKDLQDALSFAIEYSFNKEALIEEYIEGREISVEFISYQGKHYPLQITDKVTSGAPYFVELEQHQPSTLSKEMYAKIYDITSNALNALGLTYGASHSEYKITNDGRIATMEIGGRMGGDFIGSDLVRLSTGYDFTKGVIDVALGEFEPPHIDGFQYNMHSGVFFLSKDSCRLEPILKECVSHPQKRPEIVKAEIYSLEMRHVTRSSDRSGYFIYQSDNKLSL